MAEDHPGALPETPVADVTLDRVAEILQLEGLEYEEDVSGTGEDARTTLRTGYANSAIAFTLDEGKLVCDSLWRGIVALNDGASLMATVNQWNQSQFTPVLRFFEQQGSHLVVSAYRQVGVQHGLSRNQLGAFVLSSIETINESFAYVEEQFPELVTWRYEA